MIDYIQQFWKQVNKGDDCWLWTGAKTYNGYGGFYANIWGKKFYRAHRFSWYLNNGPIPGEMYVLHECDNRCCVNPAHLRIGLARENSQDMVDKGRSKTGEKHWNSKLTDSDIYRIRFGGEPIMQLSREIGIHNAALYRIRNGQTWTHLPMNADEWNGSSAPRRR